ncbi:MAG: ATP-binding protein [Myxococcota bacterium]|nr:ATP-binding protein [Myxococcota bacterium]
MWIERAIAKTLVDLAHKRPCLVLSGYRQSGKTSLLIKTFETYRYVSLDLPTTAEEAESNGNDFIARNNPPVIIDEIQYAPKLLRYVKADIDANRDDNGRFLITGSQKFHLMERITESLAGRASILELHSLSASEYQRHRGRAFDRDDVANWMIKGGYPEIWSRDLLPARFFSDYLATYLERDVRSVLGVRNLRSFDRFLRLCAARTGQLVSYNAIAGDLGISANTVKSWMSVLEASNVIGLLEPYFENLGKRIVKTPKLYFMDTGLVCFLTGIRNESDLLASPLLGAIFETHVYGQMVRHFTNQGVRPPLYFYRDRNAREVDFLIPHGRRFEIMECKWSSDPSQNQKGFEEITKLVGEERIISRTVITPHGPKRKKPNGVVVAGSVDMDFLKN